MVDLSPGHVLRLTPNELAVIDKALTEAEGDRGIAAKLLGVAYVQISQAISRHPVLRSQWIQKDDNYVSPVPSDSARLVDRHAPGEVSTEDELRAEALTKIENKLVAVGPNKELNKSLAKLGFRTAEIEKLSSMEDFAGQHFTKTLSLLHGGIVRGAARLMLLMEEIEEEYLMDDTLSTSDRNFWWDSYFKIIESLRSLTEQSNRAAVTRALVKQKGNSPGLGKPGFSAIQINVGRDDKK